MIFISKIFIFIFIVTLNFSPVQAQVNKITSKNYTVYYYDSFNKPLPVIIWFNGFEAAPWIYEPLLKDLANHDFIVCAVNSPIASIMSFIKSLNWLINQNKKSDSKLYNRINIESVGIAGHSYGGGVAILASYDNRVTATAALMPVGMSIEGIQCPLLLIAGGKDKCIPSTTVSQLFELSPVKTVFAVLENESHYSFLTDISTIKEYLTAWFSAYLHGETDALQIFQTFEQKKFGVKK